MQQRKNMPGYVRVPLPRSNQNGGTDVAHFWVKDGTAPTSPGLGGALKELCVDFEEQDAEDIMTQEIIYAFEGDSPSWHRASDGFDPDFLASKYGERFRGAHIVHVAGESNLYCIAAHGTSSLLNAIEKEILNEDDPHGDSLDVEQASVLLWGFTSWKKLIRHGVIPVDVTPDDPPVLPSVTINGQVPIRGGKPFFLPGDVIERDIPDSGEMLTVLHKWEKGAEVAPPLSDVAHQYSGAITTNKLHRTFFFPTKSAWEQKLKEFVPGQEWLIEEDVTDFYYDRHHSSPASQEKQGKWVVRLETFGLEGVPAAQLAELHGGDRDDVRAGEWLVPGPVTTGVLRVDAESREDYGYAVVYLLAA